MNKYAWIACWVGWAFTATAQHPDSYWPIGAPEFSGFDSSGNAAIHFIPDKVTVEKTPWRMHFERAAGVFADSSGNLLLLTNGCYIANGQGDTLLNGEGLNPGAVHDQFCEKNGYPSPQGAIILAQPQRHGIYYVFHNSARYLPGTGMQLGPFYYSIVDLSANGGKGAVTQKNQVLADGNLEPFAAVRHGNGRDWWVIVPEWGSNRYLRFLFAPDGVKTLPPIVAGPVGDCRRVGSSVFSPDGSRFARRQHCKAIVFQFDRCTGLLSSPLTFDLPRNQVGGSGVAFSKNGDRVFVNAHLAILSADLNAASPSLDTLVATDKLIGTGLGSMQEAVDGSFYFTLAHRAYFFPKFTYQEDGTYVFLQKGLHLPVSNIKTLPNFPNFRLLDLPGSPCDTLGITSTDVPAPSKPFARAYPNPATDEIRLEWENLWDGQAVLLRVFDTQGRKIYEINVQQNNEVIPLEGWPKGLYLWELRDNFGNKMGGKFEKT